MFLSCAYIFISSLPVFATNAFHFNYTDIPYFYVTDIHNGLHELDGYGGLNSSGEWVTYDEFNDSADRPTAGYPGYRLHCEFQNGDWVDCVWKMRTCTRTSSYVKGFLIKTLTHIYYVIVQTEDMRWDMIKTLDDGVTKWKIYYEVGKTDCSWKDYTSIGANTNHSVSPLYLTPLRFWFGSLLFIVIPCGYSVSNSSDHMTQGFQNIDPRDLANNNRYSVINEGQPTDDELQELEDQIGEGAVDVLGAQEDEETTEEYTGTTEYSTYSTIIDSSAEYSKLSEFNSKLDEQDSNISGLNDKISSNLDEVSSNLGDVKSLYEGTLGWLPSWLIALIVCGAIMIIAVKVMGR